MAASTAHASSGSTATRRERPSSSRRPTCCAYYRTPPSCSSSLWGRYDRDRRRDGGRRHCSGWRACAASGSAVGHIGNKPLRATSEAARAAAAAAVAARDGQAQLVGLLTEQRRGRGVSSMPSRRGWPELQRVAAWAAARELGAQLAQARELVASSSDDGGPAVADDDLVRRVTVALAALDERGGAPPVLPRDRMPPRSRAAGGAPCRPRGRPRAEPSPRGPPMTRGSGPKLRCAPTPTPRRSRSRRPRRRSTPTSCAVSRPSRACGSRGDVAAEQRVCSRRGRLTPPPWRTFELAQVAHREQVEAQQRGQGDFDALWATYQREQERYAEQRAALDAAVAARRRSGATGTPQPAVPATQQRCCWAPGGLVALLGSCCWLSGRSSRELWSPGSASCSPVVGLVRRAGRSTAVGPEGRPSARRRLRDAAGRRCGSSRSSRLVCDPSSPRLC